MDCIPKNITEPLGLVLVGFLVLASCDTAVLKNLMLYLKTKSLTSENNYKQSTKEVDDMFMDLMGVFQRYYDTAPEADKTTLRSILDLIIMVSQQVHTSHRQAESAMDDFKIYIRALESSYKNMDSDFDKTVAQPAEREADEKAKEEEEREKAIEEYTKRGRPKFYE
jgi:hypothetical protein